MTIQELKTIIAKENIAPSLYSLDEGLKPNAHILIRNYGKWEYFFLDEKGDRISYQEFINDEEAFRHLWGRLENELKYQPSIPPKSVYNN